MTRFYIKGRWVELKELVEKAEKWDESVEYMRDGNPQYERIIRTLEKRIWNLEKKLEAIKNYLIELEDTGRFIDKQKLMNILEGE